MRSVIAAPSRRNQQAGGKRSWRAKAVATAAIAGAVLVAGVLLVGAVMLTGTVSADAAFVSRVGSLQSGQTGVNAPPPHQLAALNFLLGTYTCSAVSSPGAAPVTTTWTTTKVLDGNYYQMSIKAPLPRGGTAWASWTFGWDAVDLNYIAGYFDSTGAFGAASSHGWQNGQFKFPGNYTYVITPGGTAGVGKGVHLSSQDDFRILGPGHFTDSLTALLDGQWTPKGSDDCHLTSK